jgi:hypothetical protein
LLAHLDVLATIMHSCFVGPTAISNPKFRTPFAEDGLASPLESA